MSIDRRFGIIAAALCIPLFLLSGWLFSSQWRAYSAADQGLRAFQTYRSVLFVAEKVSFERGPTNSVLGEDLPLTAARMAALQKARDNSDAALKALLERLDADDCERCLARRSTVVEAQTELAAARANIDRLIRKPLARRSDRELEDAVGGMVDVIPHFASVADASTAEVVAGDPDLLNYLIVARFAATLREQAGLLGSRFTAALASQRPLTEREQLGIERTLGRIDELRAQMLPRVQDHPALAHKAFIQVQEQYMGEGLAYVAKVRELASHPPGANLSTGEFAEQYVPLMHSIIDFRDEVLGFAETDLRSRRHREQAFLMGTGSFAAILTGGLLLMVLLFRGQVIRPFVEATRLIRELASGDLTVEVPQRAYRGELGKLFDAVQTLKTNNIERARLEQERHRLIAELRTMAETDSLTQLLNRRSFEFRARAACLKRDAEESEVALIMFDIDHFKRINDTYGHAAGDRALQVLADLCRETWRKDDVLARIGGEEFAVVMAVQDRAEAVGTAHRLRERLSRAKVLAEPGQSFTFSASFGIAFAARADSPDVSALLKRADGLLYRAKVAGRNCIEVEAAVQGTQTEHENRP